MTDPLQLVNTPALSNFITRDYLNLSLFSFHRENLRIIPADIPLVQIVISWCRSMSGPQPIRGRYAGPLTNQVPSLGACLSWLQARNAALQGTDSRLQFSVPPCLGVYWSPAGILACDWLTRWDVCRHMTTVRQPDWRPTLVQDMQQTTVQSVFLFEIIQKFSLFI